jgi:hypothetical protein
MKGLDHELALNPLRFSISTLSGTILAGDPSKYGDA